MRKKIGVVLVGIGLACALMVTTPAAATAPTVATSATAATLVGDGNASGDATEAASCSGTTVCRRFSNSSICVVSYTQWDDVGTMLNSWDAASNAFNFKINSPHYGCTSVPVYERLAFTAYDAADGKCAKFTSLYMSGIYWTYVPTLNMNWHYASCRTNQAEIHHRVGEYLGILFGLNYNFGNTQYSIMSNSDYSTHNISFVYRNPDGIQAGNIYGIGAAPVAPAQK